jgi:hypothetical protein
MNVFSIGWNTRRVASSAGISALRALSWHRFSSSRNTR